MVPPIRAGLVFVLAIAGLAQAQAKDPWIGRRVFTKFGTILKVGGKVVDDEGRSKNIKISGVDRNEVRVYRVEHAKGEWLWLQAENDRPGAGHGSMTVIPVRASHRLFHQRDPGQPPGGPLQHQGAGLEGEEGIRHRPRRLQRGDPARPGRSWYYSNRGTVADRQGGVRQGDRRLQRGDPARPQVRRGLRQPGLRLRGQEGVRQGHRRLRRGDPARPQAVSAYRDRGRRSGRQGGARPGDRRLHRGDPARPQVRRRPTATAATPGDAKKEYDKAIADYTEAIRLDPKDADGLQRPGQRLDAKREYDRAIADFNEAIRIDPKYASAYNNRARPARQGGVRQGHRRLRRGDPDRPRVCRGVPRPWHRLARQEGVRQGDRRLRRGDPARPRVRRSYIGRGVAWADKEEYDKAIADYAEAIRIDPNLGAGLQQPGLVWATCPDEKYRDGKPAIESATRACELRMEGFETISAPSPPPMPSPATLTRP